MSVSHPTAIKVLERDGHSCARCKGPQEHIHHRRPKRMGGSKAPDTDTVVNLVSLCSNCHTHVHSNGTAASEGFLLTAQHDPEQSPIKWRGRWVRLTTDGDVTPA